MDSNRIESLLILDISNYHYTLIHEIKKVTTDIVDSDYILPSLHDWCIVKAIADYTKANITGLYGAIYDDLYGIYNSYYDQVAERYMDVVKNILVENKIYIAPKELIKVMPINKAIIIVRTLQAL